jgi:hypothetical protein
MIVLGLDVSTTNVGVCVINSELLQGSRRLLALGIPIGDVSGLYAKSEVVRSTFVEIANEYKIDVIVIEESLKSFKKSLSSPQVIACLNRFNGIVSYIARTTFDKPVYLESFKQARKQVGIVLNKGVKPKPIILQWTKNNADMSDFVWPTKTMKSGPRKGKVVEEDICFDIADAFVMAHWGSINLKINDLDHTIL